MMMHGTCTISDSVRGGGSSLTWWPTTFVTCQLLVPSPPDLLWNNIWLCGVDKTCCFAICGFRPPTYFEILYDLAGSKKFVACRLFVGSVPNLLVEILYDRASRWSVVRHIVYLVGWLGWDHEEYQTKIL